MFTALFVTDKNENILRTKRQKTELLTFYAHSQTYSYIWKAGANEK